MPAPKTPSRRSGSGAYIALVVAAVVVIVAVIAVLVTRSDDKSTDGAAGPQTYPVQITGQPLDRMPNPPASDPSIGKVAPTLSGQSLFDGSNLSITPGDGTPKLVVFVAHWCPHCQAEVPRLVEWMNSAQKPADLQLVAVSTANSSSDENSPASAWLHREHWTAPVLADNDDDAAASAYGLSAYPYLVVLDGSGAVKARTTGELSTDEITTFVNNALAK
jgi:cytochrome c biogenesis protein CcmG/thiol:disulfide interchange protein DsbE